MDATILDVVDLIWKHGESIAAEEADLRGILTVSLIIFQTYH